MTVGLLSLAQPGNSSRVTINSTSQAYLNLVKSMSFDQQITNISSDGYPVASPTVALLNRGSTKMPQFHRAFLFGNAKHKCALSLVRAYRQRSPLNDVGARRQWLQGYPHDGIRLVYVCVVVVDTHAQGITDDNPAKDGLQFFSEL